MQTTSYAASAASPYQDPEAVALGRLAARIRRHHDARTPAEAEAVTSAALARWRLRDRISLQLCTGSGAA
jgi:hypothetical protein